VVVNQHEVEEVLALARAREDKEALFRERIRSGVSTVELLGLADTLKRLNLV